MAKRGNGQGAVYLRGDGRWEAQIRLAGGRRKSLYGPTRREVVRRLRKRAGYLLRVCQSVHAKCRWGFSSAVGWS
jgi:hypothetical protein